MLRNLRAELKVLYVSEESIIENSMFSPRFSNVASHSVVRDILNIVSLKRVI